MKRSLIALTTMTVVGVASKRVGRSPPSGANFKAGTWMKLLLWISPRVIKESYLHQTDGEFNGSSVPAQPATSIKPFRGLCG